MSSVVDSIFLREGDSATDIRPPTGSRDSIAVVVVLPPTLSSGFVLE